MPLRLKDRRTVAAFDHHGALPGSVGALMREYGIAAALGVCLRQGGLRRVALVSQNVAVNGQGVGDGFQGACFLVKPVHLRLDECLAPTRLTRSRFRILPGFFQRRGSTVGLACGRAVFGALGGDPGQGLDRGVFHRRRRGLDNDRNRRRRPGLLGLWNQDGRRWRDGRRSRLRTAGRALKRRFSVHRDDQRERSRQPDQDQGHGDHLGTDPRSRALHRVEASLPWPSFVHQTEDRTAAERGTYRFYRPQGWINPLIGLIGRAS